MLTHILGQDRLHIFAANGDQWRRHRHILSPAFSSLKLKKMSSKIQQCVQTFVNQSNEGEIDIFLRAKQFALDVICKFLRNLHFNIENSYPIPSFRSMCV